jgi:hypothetical protein
LCDSFSITSVLTALTEGLASSVLDYRSRLEQDSQEIETALIHHQGIICGVAFDRSSLRRIAPYASVVAPRRLASNTLHNLLISVLTPKLGGGFWTAIGDGGIIRILTK